MEQVRQYFCSCALVLAITSFYACKKENDVIVVPPQVSTAGITAITETGAVGGGEVTSDGGGAVSARGVCWSTLANPTVLDSKTSNGTGVGQFSSSLTGLAHGTGYHVRAYATNSAGTAYGSEVYFSTLYNLTLTT